MTYFPAAAASCEQEGWEEYWTCNDCNAYFLDEACQNMVSRADLILPSVGHGEAELRGQKNATCEAEGYSGDWICPVCQCVLENGHIEPMVEHDYLDGVCTMCQTADPDQNLTAEDDSGHKSPGIAFWIVILVLACAVVGRLFYVQKKRKH